MKNKFPLLMIPTMLLMVGCNDKKPDVVVDVNEDVVGNTHIKLADGLFDKIMYDKKSTKFDDKLLDFNVDGVEKMLTESDYPEGGANEVFTNYVDGDTTQFTSYNGLYTVKVRYLAVDTPESTSEIEEWGKTASLFNKSRLKAAKHVIVQSAGCALTGNPAVADIDGYQRSLAYVWYSNEEDPTQESFRNLNLELVYEGLSLFSGRASEMDPEFYSAFDKANAIAKQLKKNIYSDEKDANYYYGSPKKLSLKDLYDESYYTNVATYKNGSITYSSFCDEYTRWTFEGVVTGLIGNAFYIQDTIDGTPYGLYCFTMRDYSPIVIGNRIRVTGVLQFYGGAYELCGMSYSEFSHQEGDIEYVRDANNKIVKEKVEPIIATPDEIQNGKYNCVLVKVQKPGTDNTVYFNTSWNKYDYSDGTSEITSYSFGGLEELNAYNSVHPFYNTSNDITVFGHFGSDMQNVDNFNTLTGTSDYLRIKISSNCRLNDAEGDTIVSYRYLTGTKDYYGKEAPHYYCSSDPDLAYKLEHGEKNYDDLTEEEKAKIAVKTYKRKKVTDVAGIAQCYASTSGNTKYSLNICSQEGFSDIQEIA